MEQRRIVLTVLEDKQANSVVFAESNLCIGYAGEHLATILGFNLPENWLNQSAKYQICFRTSDGKCYTTDPLDIPELALPSGIMIAGTMYVQVLATDSDGTVIKKTEVCKCTVGKSIADGEVIAKYDGVKLVSQLTEELQAAVEAAKEARGNLMSSVATAAGVKTGVESATKSANTAKTNVESATESANTAKTNLEAATTAANTAKENLETAIANAATATTSANNAAASANSASTAATNAANAANTAAENLQADISDANGKLSAINDAISTLRSDYDSDVFAQKNLLPNARALGSPAIIASDAEIIDNIEIPAIGKCSVMHYAVNESTGEYKNVLDYKDVVIVSANQEYTVSFYAKGSDTLEVMLYSTDGIKTKYIITSQDYVNASGTSRAIINLSSNWQRYWVKYTLSDGDDTAKRVIFRVVPNSDASNEVYIAAPQLVLGSDVLTDIEKLQQRDIERDIKKYSVSFSGSLSAGTRLDDAVGMRADVQIGTDASGVVNDFDNVSFFNRPICCCSWDSTNHKWRVNAYEGEPGFARDGSNGEIMYECTPFWYKADFEGEGAPHYVSVTGTPCEGYTLAPMFKNGYDKVYCSSYWMSVVDGKATSRNGVYGTYGSLNSLMSNARTLDEKAHLETIEALFSDYLLMLVEFATKDFQTVMLGATGMRYDSNDIITNISYSDKLDVSNLTLNGVNKSMYTEGQTISVGSTKNSENHVANCKVLHVNGDESVCVLTVDTTDPKIVVGDYVSSRPWINGATDFITASSGTMANTGRYPCIWRGKVDPWGDAFSNICNLLIKRYGDGSEDSPYSYRLQYLPEPWRYTNGAITSDYIEANFDLATTNGYVKTLSSDSRYPHIIGTTAIGASSTNYAAAYYYAPNGDVGTVRSGGNLTNRRYCSPVYF